MSSEGVGPTGSETLDRKELLTEQFNEIERQQEATKDEAPAWRERDQQGRFAKSKDQEQGSLPDAPGKAAAAPGLTTGAAAPPAPEQKEWDVAPSSWRKDKRALWETMTPEARQYAYEREQQMKAGVEPLLTKAQLADEISKVTQPYMPTIQGLGLTVPQAVEGIMRIDHQLRTVPYEQKLQLLHQVAAAYGVDLSGQLQQAQNTFDPRTQALQQQVIEMRGQWQNFVQAQEQNLNAQAETEIQKFARTAEYFEEATPTMIQLLQSGMADGIEDAYHKAVRLTPELFEQMQQAQQANAAAEKSAAADAAAKRARAAAVSPRSATPGAPASNQPKTRRALLEEQFNALSERV